MRNIRSLLITFVAFALIIILPAASAVSFSERERYYLYVTTADTAMYSSDSSSNDAELTQIGILPSGTPVSSGDEIGSSYKRITYMDENGSTHSVVIDKSVIKSNYVTLDFGSGLGKIAVPIPATANIEWVVDYLSYRGKTASQTEVENALAAYTGTAAPAPVDNSETAEEDDTPVSGDLPEDAEPDNTEVQSSETLGTEDQNTEPENNDNNEDDPFSDESHRQAVVGASVAPDSNIYLITDDNQLVLAALKELGLARSIVEIRGVEYEVETSMLVWNTTADADHRIAVIHTPKSGKAGVRKTEKPSSKVIKSLGSGTIVVAFDVQENVTGIYYDGIVGYVKNSSLLYFSSEREYQTAVLTYEGSTTNTHRINLYNLPKESSRRLTGLKAGTPVVVFGEENGFYEIDVGGRHGYVYTKFVTIEDENPEPPVVPEEALNAGVTVEADLDAAGADESTAEETEAVTENNGSDESGEAVESDSSSENTSNGGYEPFIINGYDMHRSPYN